MDARGAGTRRFQESTYNVRHPHFENSCMDPLKCVMFVMLFILYITLVVPYIYNNMCYAMFYR